MNAFIGTFDKTQNVTEKVKSHADFNQTSRYLFSKNCQHLKKGATEIFFWGELYNAPELRVMLKIKNTDPAKLLLTLYLTKQINGFKWVDGKFLVIISDTDTMYVIRDKNGIGPRFFFTNEYFAGSPKDLMLFNAFSPQINTDAAASFLYGCFVISPDTIFKDVKKLSPGGVLIYKNNTIRLDSVFDYSDFIREKITISEYDAAEKYLELLHKSIRRRIKNHSNVGVLLSGGYDSGGVIAALRDIYTGYIQSYSIGFKENPWSELPYARKMAEAFGANFNPHIIDGSEIEYLPKIVYHFGEPFAEQGFFINYMAMKSVDKNLPVVLGGDGNDQQFGTAAQEAALHFIGKRYGFQVIQKIVRSLSHLNVFNQDNLFFRLRFHNRTILGILDRENFGFSQHEIVQLIKTKIDQDQNGWKKYSNFDELYNLRNFFIDIQTIANEAILYKASRMSELHGVPLTFPYMDLEMYQFMTQLPRALKTKGSLHQLLKGHGVSKYLLKKAVQSKLPKEVTRRKKQGGFAPLGVLFSNKEIRVKLYRYILESSAAESLYNTSFLKIFFDEYERSFTEKPYWFWHAQIKGNQFLNLVLLTLWWDMFPENDVRNTLSDYLDL